MLSTRNQKLKRLSRFFAFFVIVFAGVFYQLRKVYLNFKTFTSGADFIEQSPFVPPVFKVLFR
jgi:hypothetical protein